MARAADRIKVFVVRKHYWWYNDEYDSLIGSEPILTFRDREQAEKHRQELELEIRRGEVPGEDYNPFNVFVDDPSDQSTSLDGPQFTAAVEALGLEPPDNGDWWSWWHDNCLAFTPEQREGLWALFDGLSFYDVVADFVEVRR